MPVNGAFHSIEKSRIVMKNNSPQFFVFLSGGYKMNLDKNWKLVLTFIFTVGRDVPRNFGPPHRMPGPPQPPKQY